MGSTKNHIHTDEQIELARLFKTLGHPARIAIIENLLTHDNLNCNELRNYIQLAQPTISQHIKELREVGVLSLKVVANNSYYEVNKEALEEIVKYLQTLNLKLELKVRYERWQVYTRPLQNVLAIGTRNNT